MSALRTSVATAIPPARPVLRIVRPPAPAPFTKPRKSKAAKKAAAKPRPVREHDLDNAKDTLTCGRSVSCRDLSPFAASRVRVRWRVLDQDGRQATADPFDRAHNVRDVRGDLTPAAVGRGRAGWSYARVTIEQSRPRQYPASSMVLSGVAIDSVFDATYEAECRLAGIPGVGREPAGDERSGISPTMRTAARHAAAVPIRLRDIYEQRTKQKVKKREAALGREASSIIRAAGARPAPG